MATKARDKKAMPELWIVRVARGHIRLWCAIALGVAVFLALPNSMRAVTRALIGWDAGVLLYLVWAAWVMARSPISEIRKHSDAQDEGAFAIMVLAVASATVSLAALFSELASIDGNEPTARSYMIAIATVILSWTFVHTIFAFHYAYGFYGDGDRANGLKFPGDGKPDYWDFVYFSFVIGMTFQVSDVAVTNRWIRRSVVTHGVLAFFFATTIVALTVNMAASAI